MGGIREKGMGEGKSYTVSIDSKRNNNPFALRTILLALRETCATLLAVMPRNHFPF